jgi:Mor family transcriptional regulator
MGSKFFHSWSFSEILCRFRLTLIALERGNSVIRKFAAAAVALMLAVTFSLALGLPSAQAARKKVNCTQVMSELKSGKKVREVAKDLKISRSSVYRCRRMARRAAKSKKVTANPPAAAPAAHHTEPKK